MKGGTDFTEKGIYVGESSRSLYERTREHLDDAKKDAPGVRTILRLKKCQYSGLK